MTDTTTSLAHNNMAHEADRAAPALNNMNTVYHNNPDGLAVIQLESLEIQLQRTERLMSLLGRREDDQSHNEESEDTDDIDTDDDRGVGMEEEGNISVSLPNDDTDNQHNNDDDDDDDDSLDINSAS